MMKNLFLIIITLGIFALVGCGDKAENKPAIANNSSAKKTEETAKNLLKPGDVSPDKAVAVKDLAESVKADKPAWNGKEVAVKGYVMATSGTGGDFGYSLTLKNEKTADSSDDLISCKVAKGDLPKGLLSKTAEVKGTIKEMTDKGVIARLDPCEITNQDAQ